MKVLTESQKRDLKKLTDAGYKPIAVSEMLGENIFVFNTNSEAGSALFELSGVKNNEIKKGHFHDRSYLDLDDSTFEGQSKVNLIWLNDDVVDENGEFPLGEEEFEPPYFHTSSLILDLMEENDYSIADLADRISESTDVIRNIITEKSDVTAEIASKLSKVFGKLPEHWLRTSK